MNRIFSLFVRFIVFAANNKHPFSSSNLSVCPDHPNREMRKMYVLGTISDANLSGMSLREMDMSLLGKGFPCRCTHVSTLIVEGSNAPTRSKLELRGGRPVVILHTSCSSKKLSRNMAPLPSVDSVLSCLFWPIEYSLKLKEGLDLLSLDSSSLKS